MVFKFSHITSTSNYILWSWCLIIFKRVCAKRLPTQTLSLSLSLCIYIYIGSAGYLSKTAVYKTWPIQSCLQRSTGRGSRSQKVECYTFATRNILHWDGQRCELLQFSSRWYLCAQKSRSPAHSVRVYLHLVVHTLRSWVPCRIYTGLLKLGPATYCINIKMTGRQPSRSNVSMLFYVNRDRTEC